MKNYARMLYLSKAARSPSDCSAHARVRLSDTSTSIFSHKRDATRAVKRHGLRFTRKTRHYWYSRLPLPAAT
jgi:hypothetical protein